MVYKTVKELIEVLQTMPQDAEVKIIATDCEGGNSFYNLDIVNRFELGVEIGSSECMS